MLAHVLERAAAIKGVDQVVLAVPQADRFMVSHLWKDVYGGPEKDVLGRYAEAAEQYEADVIVRLTGDCPMLATDVASDALLVFCTGETDGYMAVCQPYTPVADGWDVEIFGRRDLVNANRYAKSSQREHVTTWMRAAREDAKVLCFPEWHDWTALKCSVDTREDLQRVEQIMNQLDDPTDFSHTATWNAWEKAGRL